MMNFLDLSAASEEECRLIKEILSDTSVVNFAEPQPTQPQIDSRPPHNRHSYHHHHHLQHQNLNQDQLHQQKQLHPQSSASSIEVNDSRLNHVAQNHSSTQTYMHPQVPTNVPTAKTLDNVKPSNHVTSNSDNIIFDNNASGNRGSNSINSTQLKPNPRTASTHTNNIGNNSINRNINSNINNTSNSSGSIKNHIYQALLDNSAPSAALSSHSSIQSNTITTSSLNQSASKVPPQNATQMPLNMAGDMNNVIGIDMTSEPPGYAIPPPPSHVSSYGPPPPAHHIYSGPPIFHQPYAHYIFPYNLPHYGLPYVLPTPNSVVSSRQQVPPQSNHPSSTNMSSSHRSNSHYIRTMKVKEMPKMPLSHQQHHHHHHHHHHQNQLPHQQPDYRNLPEDTNKGHDSSRHNQVESRMNDQETNKMNLAQEQNEIHANVSSNNTVGQPIDQQPQNNEKLNKTKLSSDDETIKVSSDEGFDTQSSLDISKQSHESSPKNNETTKPLGDPSCNASIEKVTESRAQPDSAESSSSERITLDQDRAQGPSGSASNKSWASLFKADGSTEIGSSMNGGPEHITLESENSDEDNKFRQTISKSNQPNSSASNAVTTKEQRSQEAAQRAQDKFAPRLAQKITTINLKHSIPFVKPRGLINKGNGCYINSTLQALIACPPFYNLMKELGDMRGLKRENSCTSILDSFVELFLNFPPLESGKKNKQSVAPDQKLQMSCLKAEPIEPKCIYNVLGQIKSECLRGAQEDAEEFLSSVLNGLHEEMIGLSDTLQAMQDNSSNQNGHQSDVDDANGDINNDANVWHEVGPKNRSLPIRTTTVINTPIQGIFGGSLFSIRTAGKDRCGHRSPFFDLQLDISSDNVKSVQDAIKSFTATETIQDFYCSKTKQKLDAQRRTSLDQLPPILILHLKQFIYTPDQGLKKLTKKIEYPIDLELPDSCLHDKNSDRSLRNHRTYKLLAVVYHEGKETVKGHYLTDVYHIGSGQWIRCDDSNLKVVASPRIENPDSTRTPYILFYRRHDTLRPPQASSYDNKKKI